MAFVVEMEKNKPVVQSKPVLILLKMAIHPTILIYGVCDNFILVL